MSDKDKKEAWQVIADAQRRSQQDNTAKLKAARLAHEAANPPPPPEVKKPRAKKKAKLADQPTG